MGAGLNVKINAEGLLNKEYVKKILNEAASIEESANRQEREILEIVNKKIRKESV
jgi:formiminotetrahydrofolate cyclodeaminase